jgi:hypothetical protein
MKNRTTLFILLLSLPASAACAQSGRLLVAQKGERSLGVVDPVTGMLTVSIPENGITGHEVASSPDGRLAYVPIYGDSGVGRPGSNGQNLAIIDVQAKSLVGSVDFKHGVRPHDPVVGPKSGLLYVTTELDRTVTIIDPKTLKIVGAIPTGQAESHMLVLSHDGKLGYTANVGPGTVSVLDMAARKTLKIIPISAMTQRISISMDDKWVFTADQTKPQMAVIDTSTNQVKSWIPLDGMGYGSAATLDGHWLLMTMPSVNKVAVIDLTTMKVARQVETPPDPEEVLVRPDGKVAYVSCPNSGKVAEIDIAGWTMTRSFDTGKGSDGLAWAATR